MSNTDIVPDSVKVVKRIGAVFYIAGNIWLDGFGRRFLLPESGPGIVPGIPIVTMTVLLRRDDQ